MHQLQFQMNLIPRSLGTIARRFLIAAMLVLPGHAVADLFTLRIGSGHPAGPTVYVTVMRDYVVPELKRRVAEETEHELRIIEGYGGSIASVRAWNAARASRSDSVRRAAASRT